MAKPSHSSPSRSQVASAIAVAAEPPWEGCRTESFWPARHREEMRACKKAAIESTHSDWFKRHQAHGRRSEMRRMMRTTECHRSSRRLLEESLQHADSMSTRDREQMHSIVALDRELASTAQQFREDTSQQMRSSRRDFEHSRCQVKQQTILHAARHNEIQARFSQKCREMSSANTAVLEEITRQTRRHRATGPGIPHTPRTAFTRAGLARAGISQAVERASTQ